LPGNVLIDSQESLDSGEDSTIVDFPDVSAEYEISSPCANESIRISVIKRGEELCKSGTLPFFDEDNEASVEINFLNPHTGIGMFDVQSAEGDILPLLPGLDVINTNFDPPGPLAGGHNTYGIGTSFGGVVEYWIRGFDLTTTLTVIDVGQGQSQVCGGNIIFTVSDILDNDDYTHVEWDQPNQGGDIDLGALGPLLAENAGELVGSALGGLADGGVLGFLLGDTAQDIAQAIWNEGTLPTDSMPIFMDDPASISTLAQTGSELEVPDCYSGTLKKKALMLETVLNVKFDRVGSALENPGTAELLDLIVRKKYLVGGDLMYKFCLRCCRP